MQLQKIIIEQMNERTKNWRQNNNNRQKQKKDDSSKIMDGCVDVAATAPVVVGKIFVKMKFQIMKNPIAISLYSIEYPSA